MFQRSHANPYMAQSLLRHCYAGSAWSWDFAFGRRKGPTNSARLCWQLLESRCSRCSSLSPVIPVTLPTLQQGCQNAGRKGQSLAAKLWSRCCGCWASAVLQDIPAGMHSDELEINDYPQIARQKITHRDRAHLCSENSHQNVSKPLDPAFCKCPEMISNSSRWTPYLDLTLGFLVNPADACCSEFCDRSHWWQSKKWRVPKCRPKLIGLVAPTRVWTCLNIPWNAAHPSGQGPALCFWSSHARRQGKLCLNSTLRPTGLAAWRDLCLPTPNQ